MDFTELKSSDLKNIGALLKQKEKLLSRVGKIDRQLAVYGDGPSTARAPKRTAGRRLVKVPRGQLKEQIIAAVKKAGKKGIHVKELADKLGVKLPNIRTWFHSTSTKIKQIKKVSPATYGWVE